MSYARIMPRRGTHDEWSLVNPILEYGELVVECPKTGVGTGLSKFKIGDGETAYNDLPYAFDGTSAQSLTGGSVDSFHLLTLRSGTTEEWKVANPVLEKNELIFDITANSFKVGDGKTNWSDLSYINGKSDVEDDWDCGDEDEVSTESILDNSKYNN